MFYHKTDIKKLSIFRNYSLEIIARTPYRLIHDD